MNAIDSATTQVSVIDLLCSAQTGHRGPVILAAESTEMSCFRVLVDFAGCIQIGKWQLGKAEHSGKKSQTTSCQLYCKSESRSIQAAHICSQEPWFIARVLKTERQFSDHFLDSFNTWRLGIR